MRRTVVIKYGGHAMDKADLSEAFAGDLAQLAGQGVRIVVVHGGGPQISDLLKRLQIESRFVDGLRVTDEAAMQAVEMALCGTVNKDVVRRFSLGGVKAAGVSGRDGGLLTARLKRKELGLVGDVVGVDPRILDCLLDGGFLPVVAPVANGPDGEALNINADTAAGAIAGAMHADDFVLVSDVPGVLDGEGRLIPSLDRERIARLRREEVITGGMIPKVEACLNGLAAGCGRSLILDGRQPSSLVRFLLHKEPLGTEVLSTKD
ncbi:MAG: acetylglutamate kinase [Desulfovibrio sp.]|nr:acetylglutamate kinase [Desulfovibrio sp.]